MGLQVLRCLQLEGARIEGKPLGRLSEASYLGHPRYACVDIYVYICGCVYEYFQLTGFYPPQPEKKTRGGCWCLFV